MRKSVENIKNGKPFRILDLIIYALVLVLVVLAIVFVFRPQGTKVRVIINGDVVDEFSLSDTVDKTYELHTGTARLIISDNTARVIETTCPDHICERTGKISKAGEKIICIPNGFVIEVTGESEVEGTT